MDIVCLDLEGVLVPEIWIEFADAAGIEELKRTTRDEPDYAKLMQYRLDIMNAHGLTIGAVQEVIATIEPMDGAREFLDELRSQVQVIIVSDTFVQFAKPLMQKLGWPTIFCNELIVGPDGTIQGYRMRKAEKKEQVIALLQQIGFQTIAAGDSHNDLGMIQASKAGFLFRTTPELKTSHPEIPALETYEELLTAIEQNL